MECDIELFITEKRLNIVVLDLHNIPRCKCEQVFEDKLQYFSGSSEVAIRSKQPLKLTIMRL